MKTKLLSLLSVIGFAGTVHSQCAVTSAPMNNCNYFSTNIVAFSLNNIASNNAGCSNNGYGQFNTPVRALTMGNSYNWTATTGNGYYNVGFAIWIDLDGDGFYQASEMLATSPPNATHSGQISIPFTATPGNNRPMRIRSGWYSNITGGQACTNWLGGYGETEDYLVDIIAPPPCTGSPFANTVVVTPSTGVCPGAGASLSLAATYTNFGYTYQWGSSTVSNVGPFTAVPGATNSTFVTPGLNTNTWYQVAVTCTNGGVPTLATGYVFVQGTTISQVPYIENFEGITRSNSWPNCSWAATNPTTVSRTYTTAMSQQRTANSGSKFASFFNNPSGTNYVYTNGIQLYAGVTYSAALWYKTNNYGDLNWTDMSILYGQSQTSGGLTSIVSTNGPAASIGYKALTNTFTVPTSGIYYIAVKGSNSGGCCAQHLNWDDLSITAPCSINTPSLALTPNSTTVCNGGTINIAATGAHTYTWSTAETGDLIYASPNSSTTYTVAGTNTMTGCMSSTSQYISVIPSPNVLVYTNKNAVCAGESANMTAIGALTYTWSTSSQMNNQSVIVTPAAATSYTVIGANAQGCSNQATQFINVFSAPSVTATAERTELCKGESVMLAGSGAATYQWMANTLFINTQQAIVSPNVPTTYTLVGTDANGCSNAATVLLNVSDCLGLNNITTSSAGVKVYPNPTNGVFTIEMRNTSAKMIEVTDLTGRVVLSTNTRDQYVNVNLNGLSNGIYYVKIQTENVSDVIKVVKQ